MMRIRYPFAGAFFLLLMIAGYLGLLPQSSSSTIATQLQTHDKFLHLITFFLLSLAFYWIIDTSRRRTVNLTLVVCTLGLGVGSEFLQGLLPNDRVFDLFDLIANVVGSLGAIGLSGWYHKRMLERRRKSRYGLMEGATDDVELGVGVGGDGARDREGLGPQESGVMTLEQEVDNWDENAEDNWDSEDGPAPPESHSATPTHKEERINSTPGEVSAENGAGKRAD